MSNDLTPLAKATDIRIVSLSGESLGLVEDPNSPGMYFIGTAGSIPPPAAPVGLVLVSKTSTTVTLSWGAVFNADSYRVVVSGVESYLSSDDNAGFSVLDLDPSTTYTFKVHAVNAGGRSADSAPLTVTTNAPSTPVPATPTGLSAPSKTGTAVDLTWTAVAGASSYRVLRNGTQVSASLTSAYFTDTGLIPSTAYTYTVFAVNEHGSSATAASLSVTTNAAAVGSPSAPAVTVASKTDSTVTLTWPAVGNVETYLIFRNGTFVTYVAPVASPTYTATGLSPSTAYELVVLARNVSGSSSSGVVPVTTEAAPVGGGEVDPPPVTGGRPALVRSKGPNGKHFPANTPWFTDTTGVTVLNVACSWAAINSALAGISDGQADAGVRIVVAPGTLTGSGASSNSPAVIENKGSTGWAKNVLIMPRDGFDSVKVSGGMKFLNVNHVSFFMPGNHTSGIFYLGDCTRSYIGWSKWHSGNIKRGGANCGTYEAVMGFRQATGSQDSFQGWPANGSTITGMEHHGSTFGPATKLSGDSGHCDTIQYEAIGSGAYLAGKFMHKDCVIYGSSNQTFQLAGPGGSGWNVDFDNCMILGALVWTKIFPIQSGWYQTNSTIGLGGGDALIHMKDCFLVGKSNAQRYGTVSNTRIASTGSPMSPASGAFTDDSSIASWTAADIYSRTIDVHTATGINNLRKLWKW